MKKHTLPYFFLAIFFLIACKKGDKKENQPPNTILSPQKIDVSGELRLKSTVQLHWFGSDADGYVVGYEFSQDNKNWTYTTKNDSTFIFIIQSGKDTSDIDFWVRAIDNFGLADPTPAKLIVPIKNTPPTILLNKSLSTSDTALLVATLFWEAEDPDGYDNLSGYQIKINNSSWFELSKKLDNISITPQDPNVTGTTLANIYANATEQIGSISGLKIEDTNSIYIRSYDLSKSYSKTDTLSGLYFKRKNSDLLVIGGDRDRNKFYRDHLSTVYPNFDYIDYTANDGAGQPTFWNPTFTLMLLQYDKLFIYSDKTSYLNKNLNKSTLILEAASESIQEFINQNKKAFIIGYFNNPLDSTSNLFKLLNIKKIDPASKGLFLEPLPNSLKSEESGYPDLGTTVFPETFSPFEKTADVVEIYSGQFDVTSGYTGPTTLGIKKQNPGTNNTYQVFIASSMASLNADFTKIDSLFNHVLNVEFNW